MKKLSLFLILPVLLLCGCEPKNKLNDKTLVIGCSPTPHAVILEAAKPLFKAEGYDLDVRVLNDYVTPNTLLNDGDLDANYFQHVPYLDDFNVSNKTDLTWIVKVHFEPMGIYSTKHKNLEVANPLIAIPNDTSNGERARALLEENNIVGRIIEVEAQALPSVLEDVDFAVINGNYALSANITNRCIVTEDKNSTIAQRNANVIAIKRTSLNYEWVEVIKKVMTSETIAKFINEKYGSSVIPVF
jgi:D-methionine transport system substrate-binding protein